MGKKGTKRKTKWRALPLGEEAGGSGNEKELHDEDQSTTSSVVGGQLINIHFKRQSFYYKTADKPYRQTRRYDRYDRFRHKEPLVKLESKTFDEEEYTKITTPRQDVLFKKGYFGRKRESSTEENVIPSGEMDVEEPMMDQIIITNGFVDERGHYLVNGNSYEIYDPYSNTVTVVVGPPPYANGVTQPVLAAVSCQPVPLQPVDWYPPGADWPSQGSAWTPSYARNPHSDTVNVPDGAANFSTSDPQIPNLYHQPAFVMQGYPYSESSVINGAVPQGSTPTEAQNFQEESKLELKKTRRKSTDPLPQNEEKEKEEEKTEPNQTNKEELTLEHMRKNHVVVQDIAEIVVSSSSSPQFSENQKQLTEQVTPMETQLLQTNTKQVEKQNHSTQTNILETSPQLRVTLPGKESHSTQTPPEETYQSNKIDFKAQEKNNKNLSNTLLFPQVKPEKEAKPVWKSQGNRYGNLIRKFQEESPTKNCQQRINYNEERKSGVDKSDSCSVKVSYAKKAMSGLENINPKVVNGSSGKVMNGGSKNQTLVANGMHQVLSSNEMNKLNNAKQLPDYEDKRNGFVRTRNTRGKSVNDRTSQKFLENKFEEKHFKKEEKKCEESRSQSEKSSTISELSSPTELSSGQNTPPEKLIVQKMEEEINKSFEEKFKLNFAKAKEEEKDEVKEKKTKEKSKGKKKKNKEKLEIGTTKEPGKGNKKKKKRTEEDLEKKSDSDNSSEEIPFLKAVHQKDILFESWEGLKDDDQDLISEMGLFLNGGQEILKSLGLNDDKTTYSKLPLHSDLLMMLPTFGWSRPKLKIENFFASTPLQADFFTKRNITNMKSTKPEEFFASIIDSPVQEKTEKRKESLKKPTKPEEATVSIKKTPKTGGKVSKNASKKSDQSVEEKKIESEIKDKKLGIVEAVNTWLQEQSDSEKFISVESFENLMTKEEISKEEIDQKNGASNPIHALSPNADSASVADFRKDSECIRVANVINDGFMHVSEEFQVEKNCSRMYRSSSWDAKLSEVKIKKHFKFLTDSASFCQDLISDIRNGLPIGNEYATEEFCDPKQAVMKYYTLTPNGRMKNESVSENEVFDALEYKFLTKENQEDDGKCPEGNGNASITDSGVHSDMELSEDNAVEQLKETTCKLQ